MQFKKSKPVLIGAVLASFFIGAMGDYAYAYGAFNNIPFVSNQSLFIPANLGFVKEQFKGTSDKFVYYIADLHCHKETQLKIAEIVKMLKKKHKKELQVVGIEGSWGEIDLSFFDVIKDKKKKKKILKHHIEQGDLSGAEYYKAFSKTNEKLYGIENKDLYLKNFNNLCTSLEYKSNIDVIVVDLEDIIKRGKRLLYFDLFDEIDEIKKKYKNKKMSMEAYVKYLLDKSERYFIDTEKHKNISRYMHTKALEKRCSISQIQGEARDVIKMLRNYLTANEYKIFKKLRGRQEYYEVLKQVIEKKHIRIPKEYRNLEAYYTYLDINKNIDIARLYEEIEIYFYITLSFTPLNIFI